MSYILGFTSGFLAGAITALVRLRINHVSGRCSRGFNYEVSDRLDFEQIAEELNKSRM